MSDESIFGKLSELFDKVPKKFSILQEQIDVATQMEYFEASKSIKEKGKNIDINEYKTKLFTAETNIDEKKEVLLHLAYCQEVEAYRAIEKFLKSETELKEWATIALQESRMLIESNLLDESQVFISTGLGGKNLNLRYFIVLLSSSESGFSESQKKIIKSEFEYAINNNEGEVEKIEFPENFATLVALFPLDSDVHIVLKSALLECNQLGNFLQNNFLVTNVKVFSNDEIREMLKNRDEEMDNEIETEIDETED